MVKLFRKYFIPHRGNHHRPHFLRRKMALAVLGFVFLVELAFLVQIVLIIPKTNFFSSVLPAVLVELANADRAQNQKPALTANPLLQKAAQMKADDMAAKGYFAHQSPEGRTPWWWLDQVRYDYEYVGENLAINFSDSNEIDAAWMNSSGHRENILNANFNEVGIATAQGNYEGRQTTFVVQFFGKTFASSAGKTAGRATIAKPTPSPSAAKENETKPTVSPSFSPPAQQLFAVKGESSEAPGQTETPAAPSAGAFSKPTWLQTILTAPKSTVNYIYFGVLGVVLVALVLKIFIKIKIQHPALIFNGIFVLFVVVSLLYLNYLLVGQGSVF